eukprot:3528481-Prymnesium_polylepis.1
MLSFWHRHGLTWGKSDLYYVARSRPRRRHSNFPAAATCSMRSPQPHRLRFSRAPSAIVAPLAAAVEAAAASPIVVQEDEISACRWVDLD